MDRQDFEPFGGLAMSTAQREVIEDTEIKELVAKARAAQATFETFSQQQVDAIVRDIGKFVYDNAEPLAKMAVEETGIGV
jgi:acyl-CoA reductase-like NAD-dependent aldehyde dehydrogenase